jgi:hypothetical protein
VVNEMKRALFLAALPLLAAAPLLAAPARPLPALFAGARSLLWIAAHPDDEALAAPLLGRVCVGAGIVGFDANDPMLGSAVTWWQFLVADVDAHPSQFGAPTRRALRRFPASARAVFFAPVAAVLPADLQTRCE